MGWREDLPADPAGGDFATVGFVGPIDVLDEERCERIVRHFEEGAAPDPAAWWKGHAVTDHLVLEAATDPTILHHVTRILGPDVLLWGAQYLRREPGQEHAWHVDVETHAHPDAFVSVWVGLSNAGEGSGLIAIAGSHRFSVSIQQVASERGRHRPGMRAEEALELAQRLSPEASVARPVVRDCQALFFAGGLWHATENLTDRPRSALLLQYVTPHVPVWIPDHTRLDWPFGFTDVRAPCVLVAGRADGSSHDLRSPPPRARRPTSARTALRSAGE